MNEKIEIILKELDPGEWGFDVKILDENATVQDYLDSLNSFQTEKVSPCDGCTNCCWERVPLTLQDVNVYVKGLEDVTDPLDFLKKYTKIREEENFVDIILKRKENNSCVFLDESKGRCKQWPLRSLVCQSYVCLASSKRARDLRQQIVNFGEDQLCLLYLGKEPTNKKDYKDLRLIDILKEETWKALREIK